MVNLHLHTNYSDGVLAPNELLKKLEANKVTIASITDHDSVDAYFDKTLNVKANYSGILIPGVEMKCTHNGYSIEILGYYIDITSLKPYLDKKRETIIEFQKYAFVKGKEVCDKLGLKYDKYELKPGEWAGLTWFNLLSKYYDHNAPILGPDVLAHASTFFRRTFVDPESPFFVPEEGVFATAKETVEKIHEVGGIAFVAHVGQYKMIKDKIAFLDDLHKNAGIDGVECYYSLHIKEETKEYLTFCKNNNLLISGGSDYHGTPSQNIIIQDDIDLNNLSWLHQYNKQK